MAEQRFKICRIALAVTACFGVMNSVHAQAAKPAPVVQSNQLEEIIVTAQKVESTVQKTPIAIQTISSQELLKQGVQSTKDLQRLVPGLAVQQTGPGVSFFIRGVGNNNETSISDNGLAISLDQMYFSRPFGPDMSFYDIERIEVLKGPQGTLYGRNATGGSISIISKKPVLGFFGGDASIEFGNYSAVKLNGAINVPVSEDVAMRVAFQSNRHRGFLKDGYDDADTNSARLHLYWEPSDRVSLLLSGEYMHNGQKGPGSVPYPNNSFVNNDPYAGGSSDSLRAYERSGITDPFVSNITGATFANGLVVADPRNCLPGCNQAGLFTPSVPGPYLGETRGFIDITVKSFRSDLEANLGFATLSVIPTYLQTDTNTLYYDAANPTRTPTHDHQGSLEARLTSPQNQRLTWILGTFYQKEKQDFSFYFGGGRADSLVGASQHPDVETESKAIFGQANYKIIENLTGTLGYRATRENKSSRNAFAATETYSPPFAPSPFGPPAPTFFFTPLTSSESTANTYRASLDWQATPRNLLYTAFSTGFHAGGFNDGSPPSKPLCTPSPGDALIVLPPPPGPPGPPPPGPPPPPFTKLQADFSNCNLSNTFKPEHLDAFSVGSKNRFLNNTLQFNIELYSWKYKDQQQTTLGPSNDGFTILRYDNAGSSTIKGIDAEGSWLITPDDLVSANVNYNKSKYGTFVTYVVLGGSLAAANAPPFVAGAQVLTGKPFLNAPEIIANFGYQHTFHLANGGKLTPSIDGQYSSKVTFSYATPPQSPIDTTQDAYTKYNVNLGYSAPDGKWDVNLFVRNVENKATVLRTLPFAPAGRPIAWAYLAAPRTFGMNLSARF